MDVFRCMLLAAVAVGASLPGLVSTTSLRKSFLTQAADPQFHAASEEPEAGLTRDEMRHRINGVVTLKDGRYEFNYMPKAVGPARGSFVDSRHTRSGFGILHVNGNPAYSDEQQMYAAGYLEGWLTAERIYHHYHNMKGYFNMSTSAPMDWMVEQDGWIREQAQRNKSDVWVAVGAVLSQFDGLLAGYNARAAASAGNEAAGTAATSRRLASMQRKQEAAVAQQAAAFQVPPLSRADLLLVNAVGDLGDLIPALDHKMRPAWHDMTADEMTVALATRGKCSALVKVTGDLSDLLLAHSSWYTYAAMQRIYKHYALPLSHPAIKLRRTSCSSYGGELSSDDDFYLLDSGLAILQTTHGILNTSLYDSLTPKSLPSWMRVRAANMLATTGRQWSEVVDVHQSGTCNNQYMVVDLKRFQPRRELQEGLLWVVEQIPGLTVAADQTPVLERGYWPSYNVPFYSEIYEKAGYKAFMEEHARRGSGFSVAVEGLSYQLAPRAAIFRRDEGLATGVHSLQALMRSNDWDGDTYSMGSSFGAICGRGDVDAKSPKAYGCFDTKAANFSMATQRRAVAVVGPTHPGHMRPFSWAEGGGRFADVPHLGQPDTFDFQFQLMSPDA